MYKLFWTLKNVRSFDQYFKHSAFIKEFICACCIAYAMAYAGGCCSISQSTAYAAITGEK